VSAPMRAKSLVEATVVMAVHSHNPSVVGSSPTRPTPLKRSNAASARS
jgi:hypothetical protein